MQHRARLALVTPLSLLLMHCSDGGGSGGPTKSSGSRVEMRVSTPVPSGGSEKFRAGAASASGLESLKYQISSISICEGLETNGGSGFSNPTGCLELYRSSVTAPTYGLGDDFSALANAARGRDEGYVDLLSESSRAQLAGSTVLTHEHVRSYHYGLINWALPIKLKASIAMSDGSRLYTRDGVTKSEQLGVDNYRNYFTEPTTPLTQAPAEEAVVLLPNGGNWFQFQRPFTITDADIDEARAFVLDLVFNPEGIVRGYSDSYAHGSISQRDPAGAHLHDITVPMLDLAPLAHRSTEALMRESYRGSVRVGDHAFDMRVELYYVEGDTSGTVYGVDVKSLINADTRSVLPELSKVSYVDGAADGTLTFSSFRHTPVMTGMRRVEGNAGQTRISLVCAQHNDRAGAEGGAAIVLDRCTAPTIEVELSLTGRSRLASGVPTAIGGGPDAGADAAGMNGLGGGADAAVP